RRWTRRRDRDRSWSEDFFLAPEISEGADVSHDEGNAELIFCADVTEVDAAVLESQAAAAAVVIHLKNLGEKGRFGDVVVDAWGGFKAFAMECAIAEKRTDLIGKRLENRISR